MEAVTRLLQKIWNVFNIVTDWFLIIVGAVLVAKALFTIDVAGARYIVITIGVLFCGIGIWCRHRRLRRHRLGEKGE